MLEKHEIVNRLRANDYAIELIGAGSSGWVGIVRTWGAPWDRPDHEIFRTWDRHPSPEEALQNCLEWANKQTL